ncbi:PIN domain-containing protein [Propionivibrio sp.]|uniref:PIN domain-containing protein n=1 Tax=Propionivibrio sp. TaxID=2212460 RepID=UPI003BF00CF6
MIGLDTNVLVRYLAQDDVKQSAIATRLIECELTASHPGFISLVVLVEVCWVLKRLYQASESELVTTVDDFLHAAQFQVEQRELVLTTTRKLAAAKHGSVGFADFLIVALAQAQGCSMTVSFDAGAVREAGMTLLS